MTAGIDLITTVGLAKIYQAVRSSSAVEIQSVAFGDGGGTAYDPVASQTTLRRELARVEIDRRYPYGDGAWWVSATVPASTPAFTLREIAFCDTDGDIICLWAGADVGDGRQIGTVDYLLAHILDFSAVDSGLITVAAPDDEITTTAIASACGLFSAQLAAIRARDERRAWADQSARADRRHARALAAVQRDCRDETRKSGRQAEDLLSVTAARMAAAILQLQTAALTQGANQ